jgi:glycosidase
MDFENLEQPVEMTTHVSDWRDQIIYQVMIDRFNDGDAGNNDRVDVTAQARYHGGDWAGLEQQLDYLSELGVTALWISPVYGNVETDAGVDGYHGYWPQDLTVFNPHYGDLKSLRSLVNAAHERSMLVIIDVVTNHVGQVFFYDINLNGQPDEQVRGSGEQSPVEHVNEHDPDFNPNGVIVAETSLGEAGPAPVIFRNDAATRHLPPQPAVLQNPDVYNRRGRTVDFSVPDQLLHGDFPGGLKDLNTTRCDVKQAMVDVYARFVELTDADGFRIDTVKHVEREFWRYFTQKVRQRLAAGGKQRFFMFGESFDGNEELVGSFTKNDLPEPAELERENQCVFDGISLSGDQLDGVFHFPQYYQVVRDVFQLGQSTDRVQALWERRPMMYGTAPTVQGTGLPPITTLVNFLDNHDVPRFLHQSDEAALRLALLFLMTSDGIPCLYYGTEQSFSGGNDPANREDLWRTGFDTGWPMYQWVKALTRLRQSYVALRRGDLRASWSTTHVGEESDAGVLAFERSGGDAVDGYALVVLNVHRGHPSTTSFEDTVMTLSAPEGTVLVDVLSADGARHTVGAGGALAVTLPPLSGALLVPEAQVVR